MGSIPNMKGRKEKESKKRKKEREKRKGGGGEITKYSVYIKCWGKVAIGSSVVNFPLLYSASKVANKNSMQNKFWIMVLKYVVCF
jgi:hypothetical protein